MADPVPGLRRWRARGAPTLLASSAVPTVAAANGVSRSAEAASACRRRPSGEYIALQASSLRPPHVSCPGPVPESVVNEELGNGWF